MDEKKDSNQNSFITHQALNQIAALKEIKKKNINEINTSQYKPKADRIQQLKYQFTNKQREQYQEILSAKLRSNKQKNQVQQQIQKNQVTIIGIKYLLQRYQQNKSLSLSSNSPTSSFGKFHKELLLDQQQKVDHILEDDSLQSDKQDQNNSGNIDLQQGQNYETERPFYQEIQNNYQVQNIVNKEDNKEKDQCNKNDNDINYNEKTLLFTEQNLAKNHNLQDKKENFNTQKITQKDSYSFINQTSLNRNSTISNQNNSKLEIDDSFQPIYSFYKTLQEKKQEQLAQKENLQNQLDNYEYLDKDMGNAFLSQSFQQYPLHKFDPKIINDQNFSELLKDGPQIGLTKNMFNGQYDWIECTIIEYDKDQDKFLVMIEDEGQIQKKYTHR
ncbi:hypothetical protein PPERSA_12535 [Pseudocohnilembus persalinus]|uniref:Uncharacterized protein n=1 Tax=Pseudocohnilembus persalinus TaxID=266149 RepID=A0A0V0QBH0_PSEPJ|nr:hypothetical protein PPERSA_12535 [Pseudocohnilembus persalinus]|eukprot:KRW99431.1 hypothetical protein PPERSA_12535 [Pseudocohnilembus persalinus]